MVGPGLIFLGLLLGKLLEKVSSAHKRIDKVEIALEKGLAKIEESVEKAWASCPMAQEGGHGPTR
jgi:hypothetical protein